MIDFDYVSPELTPQYIDVIRHTHEPFKVGGVIFVQEKTCHLVPWKKTDGTYSDAYGNWSNCGAIWEYHGDWRKNCYKCGARVVKLCDSQQLY